MPIDQDQYLADDQHRAICLRCGADKFEPFDRCDECHFQPVGEELVKSAYLSVYRYLDWPARADTYSRELSDFQRQLRSSETLSFEGDELVRLRLLASSGEVGETPLPFATALSGVLATNWRKLLLVALVGFLVAFAIKTVSS